MPAAVTSTSFTPDLLWALEFIALDQCNVQDVLCCSDRMRFEYFEYFGLYFMQIPTY